MRIMTGFVEPYFFAGFSGSGNRADRAERRLYGQAAYDRGRTAHQSGIQACQSAEQHLVKWWVITEHAVGRTRLRAELAVCLRPAPRNSSRVELVDEPDSACMHAPASENPQRNPHLRHEVAAALRSVAMADRSDNA
jgi:hypothetical protein